MISWHNAPSYTYNGYSYAPDIMEYDDGVRKAIHDVYKIGGDGRVDFSIDASPYKWLTYDEFTYHVDMMRGDVYGENS